MKVELKKEHQCVKIIEELDNLIKESLSLFDDFQTFKISGANVQKTQYYETILLFHLFQKTNFEKVFENTRISFGDVKHGWGTIIINILFQLGESKKDPNFNNFLSVLNDRVSELEKRSIKEFSYYIPSRLNFDKLTKKEIEKLKASIKSALDISIEHPDKVINNQIKNKKFLNLILNRKIILRVNAKGRDSIYTNSVITLKTSALAGAITLAKNLGTFPEKWDIRGDLSLANDPFDDYFIIVENQKIVYPNIDWQSYDYRISNRDISGIKKEIINRGDYQNIIFILNAISKQHNKLKKLSKESLKLYFEAMTEKNLEISFLKFWVLIEKILKQGGKITDKSLIKMIKYIIIKQKHLEPVVDSLYKKRNDLVHEFKTDYISQFDRNLTKVIAESNILLLLNPPIKINNIEEFKILLSNISCSKELLVTKERLVEDILKFRNKTTRS